MSQMVPAPVPVVAAGVAPCAGGLVLDQQFHVGGGRDVDPGGEPGPGREGVAEAGVGVKADGQLAAAGGGRGRAGADGRGPLVVPVACAWTSSTAAPAAVDRPAYSTAATPMSAAAVVLAVMVGLVPPPAVTGAVQTDISVPSEAVKWVSSV